ncbi:hypothetical protein GE21DRAFT_1309208 [Neurospora crassa]|nr:hypothetical protein GE21DRAFT_1309208 [Neurospora crassa]
MASSSEPFPARSTKRMLEETSIDSPVKKRAKTISSNEHDLTLNHVAAFVEDTCRTGKLYVWYKAHQRLYDYLQTRRAKRLAHSSVDNKVHTPSQVTKHWNHPNAAKGPRSTTDSPPSHLPSSRTSNVPAQPPAKHSPSTRSSLRNKTIENASAVNGSKAEPPRRRKARSHFPARRSRGTAKGGTISNVTSEPMPEPEPLPLPLLKSKNSRQSNFQPKAVPGTKAERLAEYMKYWKRTDELDEEEESYERRKN